MGPWNSDRPFPGLALASALAALLVAACLNSPGEHHAGVDDFPNSVYARVAGHLEDASETETAVLPEQALGVVQGQVAAPPLNALPKGSALARLAAQAAVDSGWMVYAETTTNAAKTLTTVTTLYFLAGTDITDSLQRMLGLAASHQRQDYATGKVSVVEVRDADGDGLLLLPLAGARVAVRMEESDGGVVESADWVADGGPDRSLDSEADNRIYKAQWRKVSAADGGDTLSFAAYADADGDGIVIDNAAPTLVDLEFFEKDPAGKPEIRESRLSLRLRVSYGQDPQEIRRFRASEILRDGRLQATDFSNDSGGEDIDPRGRTMVRIRQSGTPEGDTVMSMETRALVQPETMLGLDKDSLIAYSVRVEKRLGEETSVHFALEGGTPAPPKTLPRNGKVTMEIAYGDATRVAVDGELEDGAFTALITSRDGRVYDAQWDKTGKLLRLQARRP